MSDSILIRGGRVIDPVNGRAGAFDVLIEGDRIARVGAVLPAEPGVQVTEIPSGFIGSVIIC